MECDLPLSPRQIPQNHLDFYRHAFEFRQRGITLDVYSGCVWYNVPIRTGEQMVTHVEVVTRMLTYQKVEIPAFTKKHELTEFYERMLRFPVLLPVMAVLNFEDGLTRLWNFLLLFGGLCYFTEQFSPAHDFTLAPVAKMIVGEDGLSELREDWSSLGIYYFNVVEIPDLEKIIGEEKCRLK